MKRVCRILQVRCDTFYSVWIRKKLFNVIIFGKKCFRIKIPSKQDAFDEEVEEIKESNDYSVRFDEEPTKR